MYSIYSNANRFIFLARFIAGIAWLVCLVNIFLSSLSIHYTGNISTLEWGGWFLILTIISILADTQAKYVQMKMEEWK